MSFSGKKYRRTHCENIQALINASTNLQTIHLLTSKAPVFSYIRLDETTFIFKLIFGNKVMSHRFRLGEEFELEKHNGAKVKITYTMEGQDVLNQVVKTSEGRIIYFRREFGATNKMIVTPENGQSAIIYYEVIN